jgi:energy-coupling factor transport system permease protein
VSGRTVVADRQAASPLGRTGPLTKLAIAFAWLIGVATTLRPGPPVVLTVAALTAGLVLGRIPPGRLARAIAPLWSIAAVVVLSNIVFGSANTDPTATQIAQIGPLRITAETLEMAAAIGLRVVAIASVGAVFALTTEATRLADSLVQQARVSPRFAYGALAAYGSIPRFGDDLTTLREARRLRGLRWSWHPRLLVSLLVLAIRHGDRLALAMDARAFGSGPRTSYRIVRWTWLDPAMAIGAAAILGISLALGR